MSVIARRMPCETPGRDSAAKYVTGTMQLVGKNSSRREDTRNAVTTRTESPAPVSSLTAQGSEEDRISAMFQAQGEQWKQTQEAMSHQSAVPFARRHAPAPDYPPPPGYMCYRCGQKGHWIQACPTNDDPNWEGKRVRRTTGIPRSMLKTVAKPQAEESGNYMMNDDGEYVVAVADSASWKSYQEKAKAINDQSSTNPIDPELVCPLTRKLFVKPVKTPCCKTTYSEEPIQQALLDSDFVCPKCKTEEVLLDQLAPDTEMEERVNQFKEADKKPEQDIVEDDELAKRKRDEEENEHETSKKAKGDRDDEQENNPNQTSEEPTDQMPPWLNPMMPPPPFMLGMPPLPGMAVPPMMMNPYMMQQANNGRPQRPYDNRSRKNPRGRTPDFQVL
jgi:protein MPE1